MTMNMLITGLLRLLLKDGRLARTFCSVVPGWPQSNNLRRDLLGACDALPGVSTIEMSLSDVPQLPRTEQVLSGDEWYRALGLADAKERVVGSLRSGALSDWGQSILSRTAHGDRVLEVGSGTAEISLALAKAGRLVTLLDVCPDCLRFAAECAEELGIHVETVAADAMQALPFSEGAFDCVWSSGLLEHFTQQERLTMLREWTRVSRGKVVNFVPNAACLAYRLGKAKRERNGTWEFGRELPLYSMRPEFEAAGLAVAEELSVGPRHALSFFDAESPVGAVLSRWLDAMPASQIDSINQGYLLLTVGVKGS